MEFFGRNAHRQEVVFKVNAISKSHAEIDVLNQLAKYREQTGITGGRAVLYVDRDPCFWCQGFPSGIRSGVEGAHLDELLVIYPSGRKTITPRR
jgi:hypothetical protein